MAYTYQSELKKPCPNCGTLMPEFGNASCPNDECGHQEYDDTDFECDCDYCRPPDDDK